MTRRDENGRIPSQADEGSSRRPKELCFLLLARGGLHVPGVKPKSVVVAGVEELSMPTEPFGLFSSIGVIRDNTLRS